MTVLGFVVMAFAAVMIMLDTNFGRRPACEATHVGYDRYVGACGHST